MKTLVFIGFVLLGHLIAAQQVKDSVIFYFDHNSSYLYLNSEQRDQIADLRGLNIQSLEVYAYADTLGSNEYNYWLAQRRALRIIDLLGAVPVKPTITVSGATSSFGEADKNRRVSLRYSYKVPTISVEEVADSSIIVSIVDDTMKIDDSFTNEPDSLRLVDIHDDDSQMDKPHELIVLNIAFVPGKYTIKTRSKGKVRRFIKKVKREDFVRIELHGHVCCGDNFLLSKKRAQAVQWELEKAGIDHNIVYCYGHSNREPLVPEVDKKSQRKNRRVEVMLFK